MVERIPEEVLEAARLRFKRRLAAVIVNALAESGISTDLVEDRIGMRRGGLTAYVNRLLHGKERGLDSLVDVATATGFEIVVGAQHIPGLSQPNDEGEGKPDLEAVAESIGMAPASAFTPSIARQQGFTGNICANCSSVRMTVAGHCEVCADCGTTTGCS